MINAEPLIVIGDHAYLRCTLYLDGATTPDLTGATVTAAIVDTARRNTLAGPITLSAATPGSDWTARQVVTTFSDSQTANLPPGRVRVEIQTVEAGVKTSWSAEIQVVRGLLP